MKEIERENDIAYQKLVYDVTFKKPQNETLMFKIIKHMAILFWYTSQLLLGFCK